jgi:hypothetical protein
MSDDDDQPDGQRIDAPSVRLAAGHWNCHRAALLLVAAGGRRVPGGGSELVYRFPTSAARDEALDLVRRRFGWTIADAFDGGT